jgi:hypothetical protein
VLRCLGEFALRTPGGQDNTARFNGVAEELPQLLLYELGRWVSGWVSERWWVSEGSEWVSGWVSE